MSEKILEALDYVDERFLADLEKGGRLRRRRPRRMGLLAAAAALAGLFTVTAAAAGLFGLEGWFSLRWREQTGRTMTTEQADALADITEALDMTVVDNGLRVTAEEVTVGYNGVTVLFSARLEEGELEEEFYYSFDPLMLGVLMEPRDTVYSYGFDFAGFDEAGSTAYIVFEYSGFSQENLKTGHNLHLTLCDLVYCTDSNAPIEMAVEGIWEFSIPLTTPEEPLLVLGDAEVSAKNDQGEALTLRLRDLQLSSTVLRFWHDVEQNYNLPLPELIFSDGSALRCFTGGGSRNEEKQRFEQAYEWAAPIDLDQATAIRFGEDIIPIP